ncbi:cell growth-regulating nucleolar protein [Patella vulgata]|uniref:cell growth-regulating nucleolar protein n=1 Tax=Patella vulgata TaxID=6465 RepID=UPI00217F2BBF|nr:cell growth-regulating nucleolar protein [Patella vulgata]
MVYFNCNTCGETLKRNKVEIHYRTKCRSCEVVSCVDCSKEFWGDDYKKHMTCVSEEEKYSGSNYVAKPNKGEVKQELWQQSIQEAVEKNKQNPKLRDLLSRLIDHPNIPRKQRKFENFMKSSFGVRDNKCIAQIWEIISQNTTNNDNGEVKDSVNGKTGDKIVSDNSGIINGENDSEETNKKLSKREKKEQRRLQNDKKEKKDKNKNSVENGEEVNGSTKSKKKRKRKNEDSDEEEDEEVQSGKRKRQNEDENEEEEEEEEEEQPVKKRKIKFDWEKTIITVLKTKGEDLPVKKLRKKVLAEYSSQGGCLESEAELSAKFNKKLMKNPKFKVLKERVKLVKNK